MATILIGGNQVEVGALAEALVEAGYQVSVASISRDVIEATRRCPPDVLILCEGLSEPDIFGVCAAVRQDQSVPIILVSDRSDELDRVIGLELGADEYLVSPVGSREIVARVRALLRRIRLVEERLGQAGGELLRVGDLVVDLRQYVVTLSGRPIPLKPREFSLLAFLAAHQGTAYTREQLIEEVWRGHEPQGIRTVDIHVRGLREKIEADPSDPRRLQTVRRVGYRLVADSRGQ